MRSVMALSQQGSIGRVSAPVDRSGGLTARAQRGRVIASPVRWRHERRRRALRPRSCLCLEGETPTARRARWTSLFGVDLWRADETKKARSVVALSCVPRGERGSPVSPPAAGRCSGRGPFDPGSLPQGYPSPESEPLSLATVRPLVRMSTDQHAATGTCEYWAGLRYVRFPSISRGFCSFPQPIASEFQRFRV